LTAAGYSKWQLQWIEWDTAAISTTNFLAAASVTPFFMGTYVASSFLNPITAFTASPTGAIFAAESYPNHLPTADPPGSLGKVNWFPAKSGAFADSLYI
jgi:hypothetical protein